MIWKEKTIKSLGDFVEHGLKRVDSKEEADQFLRLYEAETDEKTSRQNIKLLLTEMDLEFSDKLEVFFGLRKSENVGVPPIKNAPKELRAKPKKNVADPDFLE